MLKTKFFLSYAKRFRSYFVSLQPISSNSNAETKNEHIIENINPRCQVLWTDMLCSFVKPPDT